MNIDLSLVYVLASFNELLVEIAFTFHFSACCFSICCWQFFGSSGPFYDPASSNQSTRCLQIHFDCRLGVHHPSHPSHPAFHQSGFTSAWRLARQELHFHLLASFRRRDEWCLGADGFHVWGNCPTCFVRQGQALYESS